VGTTGLLIGRRYRLVRRVGAGGMGIVWEARDELLHRPVAVKELRLLPGLSAAEAGQAGQRAMREARLTARLVHPYAVTVFDVVEHDGQPCLVLQFVPSESLSALLRSLGRLSPAETARLGGEVGSALAAAHRLGIVHGDVKPGNVLIGDDGAARICDFGIADALGEATLGAAGVVHGTPAYLTPEVARGGEPGFASDVFALGATLFAAVEGAPPFATDEDPVRLVHRIATDLPAPPRQAGALTPLLVQMLSVDPARRPTMAEVATRLAELVPRQRALVQRPATDSQPSPEEPQTSADPPSEVSAAEVVSLVDDATARRRVPLRLGQRPERRSQRRLLVAGLVVVLLVASGTLVQVLRAPGRSASVTGTAPSASPAPSGPRGSAGAPTSSVPTYTATEFVVPFTTAVPTWVASTPATSSRNLVTWRTDDVAVRFLCPSRSTRPVAAAPPTRPATTCPTSAGTRTPASAWAMSAGAPWTSAPPRCSPPPRPGRCRGRSAARTRSWNPSSATVCARNAASAWRSSRWTGRTCSSGCATTGPRSSWRRPRSSTPCSTASASSDGSAARDVAPTARELSRRPTR
jgi:serine/threonine protein kinase